MKNGRNYIADFVATLGYGSVNRNVGSGAIQIFSLDV
jgi:hypothetical protein